MSRGPYRPPQSIRYLRKKKKTIERKKEREREREREREKKFVSIERA